MHKRSSMTKPHTLQPRLRPSTPVSVEHLGGSIGDRQKTASLDRSMLSFLGHATNGKPTVRRGRRVKARPARASLAHRPRRRAKAWKPKARKARRPAPRGARKVPTRRRAWKAARRVKRAAPRRKAGARRAKR